MITLSSHLPDVETFFNSILGPFSTLMTGSSDSYRVDALWTVHGAGRFSKRGNLPLGPQSPGTSRRQHASRFGIFPYNELTCANPRKKSWLLVRPRVGKVCSAPFFSTQFW